MGPSNGIPAHGPPASETVITSFLLSNLHCPTCVSTIKAVLHEACRGHARWVSPNIVTSVVTVEHDQTASLNEMRKALEESGFDVCGVTTSAGEVDLDLVDPDLMAGQSSAQHISQAAANHHSPSALARWITASRLAPRPQDLQSQAAKAHLLNCDQCRSAQPHIPNEKQPLETVSAASAPTSMAKATKLGQQAQMPSDSAITFEAEEVESSHSSWRATLAIGGMTCAACVNSITDNLSRLDWVSNVAVNLVNNSAVVDVTGGDEVGDDLVAEVEALGYDATLDSLVRLNHGRIKTQDTSDTWIATLAIGGMTCAACANTITTEMKKLDWIGNVTVNLLTNTAVIEFQGEANVEKLVGLIEDLGYEAVLDTVMSLTQEQVEEHERTIEIKIQGLYCEHCPSRVANSLAGFRRRLDVLSQPTCKRPIIKISYVPDAPAFTIRHILAAIEASDQGFKASIHHPPTLEERSKLIQLQHQRKILWRVLFTGIVCIPTFIIGIVYMSLLPESRTKHYMMEPWTSGISRAQIALAVMATPVYFFGADIFHVRAFKEIRTLWRRGSRVPFLQRFYRFGSMNTLIQMISAAVYKPTEVSDTDFYFDSVVFLTFFLLLGRLIESYSKSRTGDAVEMLGKLRPTTAVLVENYGSEKEKDVVVKADLLDYGDVVRITHGSSPPADGIVVLGESNFDESSLTGESRLVKKSPRDEVFSGTVNKDASILVRITGVAGKSMLDQIVSVVREGQTKRAPVENIADQLTTYFVPVVTLIAILTWLIWLSLGVSGRVPGHFLDVSSGGWVAFSLQFAISVFVVACPCGLALAAPTAIFVGGGIAAKHGILAKGGGLAFEKASRIDCVVFDKTGTLTVGGEPSVTDSEIHLDSAGDDDESQKKTSALLAALKAVEENSSHPIAKAIVSFCASQTSIKAQVDSLQEIPGKGMKATCVGVSPQESFEIIVGNEAFMQDSSVAISTQTAQTLEKWKSEAKSVALVATRPVDGADSNNWTLAATLSISDPIRAEAPHIIRALQARGTSVWMLSGDNPVTAAAVAQQLGIPKDQVLAGVLPTGKAAKITYLQTTLKARTGSGTESTTRRAFVAMVGDGINDSPALATADVGVAIGSGSDIAISSADFVLVKSDLRSVVTLLDLSSTVFTRIKVNFGWALVYNVLAVPVAAGVLYPLVSNGSHVRLDPVWASLAMALSSISVVLSSLALRSRIWGLGFRERKFGVRRAHHIHTLPYLTMNATVKRKFNALLQGIGNRSPSSPNTAATEPASGNGTDTAAPEETVTASATATATPSSPSPASAAPATATATATTTTTTTAATAAAATASPSRMANEIEYLAKKRRVAQPGSTPTKFGAETQSSPARGPTTISNITLRKWTPAAAGKTAQPQHLQLQQPKYCPGDRDQLVRRLATFQELTDWTPKPDKVNEIEWAKRGWVCQGKERVKCTLCSRELNVKLNRKEVDGKEISVLIASEIAQSVVDMYTELIVTSHAEDCLWRKKGCADSLLRLPLPNAKQALDGLRQRYDELCGRKDFLPYEFNLRLPPTLDIDTVLSYLPSTFFTNPPPPVNKALPADSTPTAPNRSALALAVLGWQGLSNPRIGPVPNSASCHTCLRRLGLWMFKSKEVDPQTGEVLVPAPMDHLDPLREHRFFCPWKNGAAQRNSGSKPLANGEEDKTGWEILVEVLKNDAFIRQRNALAHSRSKSNLLPQNRSAAGGADNGSTPQTPERPTTAHGRVLGSAAAADDGEPEDEEARKKKDQAMMSRLRRVKSLFNTKAGSKLKKLSSSRPGTSHSTAGGE
ncbi:copper-exporting ATPase-like protein [Podospora appendiculata]|uniref:Copper-exporting ATPase-like protein n=1 Tax=Podospora appendiculata TaxID=314037 RepID=A0AAE0XEP5_9PEZI|nr:copper-exporting ATPase-like protein [Podospora appendiculata]